MPQTETTGWQTVTDGDTTTLDVPDGRAVLGAEVRWRGDSNTVTKTEDALNTSAKTFSLGTNDSATVSTRVLDRSNAVGNGAGFTATGGSIYGGSFELTFDYPDGTSTRHDVSDGERVTDYSFSGDGWGGQQVSLTAIADSDDHGSVKLYVQAKTTYQTTTTTNTNTPTVTLSGNSVSDGDLSDGETSAWYSIVGLETGSNTFAHDIAGSGDAEFQVRYTYQAPASGSAFPTGGAGAPTTAAQTTLSASAQPTGGAGAPTAAALTSIDAAGGWVATLTDRDGIDERLPASAMLSVDIDAEHTAAWGATVDLPPIVDLDRFRGGALRLTYGGALVLDCPSIVGRDEADDGTLTVDALGPSAALKSQPVDRAFDDELAHDAARSLLIEDAGLPATRVTVHAPPDRPVDGEVVQSADTRGEFEDVLESRSRSSTGQFESEDATGGSPPPWQATAPLAFTRDGGVRTRQTCIVYEGESYDSSAGSVSAASATGASGGESVTVADAADALQYDFSFGYEPPEGAFSVAIRGRASGSGSGTATIRASADDRELFSVDSGAFAGGGGDGWSWSQHSTDYRPGTDDHTLVLTVSTAGGASVDIDCIAIYDGRYGYSWPAETDANDALAGPELYPDRVPLSFRAAPAGIALDSATATVTVDAPGEDARVGLTYTNTDNSSVQSIGDTTDSHTAGFDGATARLRPTVELSRRTVGSATTPTQGNAPQTLTSVETTVSGNAIPVIDSRSFAATTAFDAVQKLCEDYGFVWSIDNGRAADQLAIEVFERGDPSLRRELPPSAVVTGSSESAAAQDYKNAVTVVGGREDGSQERVSWTETDDDEIETFGREPLRIENDDLETENDCRAVARAELTDRLDEDERGGKLGVTPSIVPPGYPYRVEEWSGGDVEGWGEFAWGDAAWGSTEVSATLETASLSESAGDAATDLDFDVGSRLLAALAGGF